MRGARVNRGSGWVTAPEAQEKVRYLIPELESEGGKTEGRPDGHCRTGPCYDPIRVMRDGEED